MIKEPKAESIWRHKNGNEYRVLLIANGDSSQANRYPPTVVYQGSNGKVWSRAVSDWARSMTFIASNGPLLAPCTPSAHWLAAGHPDPHAGHYNCQRAHLALGHLTDDELANGAFMNYDLPMDIEAMVNNRPGYHPPIAWMTAVKDRIRWLSRALEHARAAAEGGRDAKA